MTFERDIVFHLRAQALPIIPDQRFLVNLEARQMTESEWLTSSDPAAMLAFLRERELVEEKKLISFGTACSMFFGENEIPDYARACLWVTQPLTLPTDRAEKDLRADILRDVFGNPWVPIMWHERGMSPKFVVRGEYPPHTADTLHPYILTWNDGTVPNLARAIYDEAGERECEECVGTGWVEGGRAISRWACKSCDGVGKLPGTNILDPAKLAILADAVDEACAAVGVEAPEELLYHLRKWVRNPRLLYHCQPARLPWLRSSAPHVRGCWAVELLRGNC